MGSEESLQASECVVESRRRLAGCQKVVGLPGVSYFSTWLVFGEEAVVGFA